ncbi:MAG: hydrogenase formation protein HypD [Lachnospiraceae bacterium]|nr:hydrogenase formation protein HypD [Lachnospiraceae bacterium]
MKDMPETRESSKEHKSRDGIIRLMEVCGTHTMAIARNGIKSLLPPGVKLISGPGCPVCVTPPQVVDAVLGLSELECRPVIATYGDMIRVPGSRPGDTLMKRRALGADVRIVYSPVDAVELAEKERDRQVIFLGAGFETTAPGTAAAIGAAADRGLKNFTVFSMLKKVEPSVRALASDPSFSVQGFLCPGHVAVVTGEKGMKFFSEDLGYPAVISGFEPEEILKAITLLLKQIRNGESKLENAYSTVVSADGNTIAQEMMEKYFALRSDIWRGLGLIPDSGFGIREEYSDMDAEKRFDIKIGEPKQDSGCHCGDVIKGAMEPSECPLFGKACVPEEPVGPCMVSPEGACAAAWKYRDVSA